MKGPSKIALFKEWACDKCGYVMDSAWSIRNDEALPREGDLTCCLQCAELYILHGIRWLPISDDELIDLPLDLKKNISHVQQQIRKFHKQRKK
jgi:hypothetical protein